MRIFVFGDSIAQGFFDSRGGWAQQLANEKHIQHLQALKSGEQKRSIVFNLSISGDTAKGVATRLADEVDVRSLNDSQEQDIVILAVGINDAILKNNRAVIDAYDFQEQYEKAIKDAQSFGAQVICVGLTAVDETKSDPWFGSTSGKQWKNNRINLFEDTIKQSAERLDTEFVALHDEFLLKLERGEDLLADGLHPNDAGHLWLYEQILKSL